MSQKSARRARDHLARKRAEQARQQRRNRVLAAVLGGIGVLAAAAGVGYGVKQATQETAKTKSGLSWPAPGNAEPAVKAAGLDLGPMGRAEHYHAHLDVFADGKKVSVPANIGVDKGSGAMSAVHTHDARGVIHVEAHVKGQRYTLGQVFTQWRVPLSATQAGPLKAGGGKTLTAYVNGKKTPGDPASIVLAPRQQIALVYVDAGSTFNPPASYRFQPGE